MCFSLSLLTILSGPLKPFSDRILSALMPFRPECLIKDSYFLHRPFFFDILQELCSDVLLAPPYTIEHHRIPCAATYLIQKKKIGGLDYSLVYFAHAINTHRYHTVFFAAWPQSTHTIISTCLVSFSFKWWLASSLWAKLCILFENGTDLIKTSSKKNKERGDFFFSPSKRKTIVKSYSFQVTRW